MKKRTNTAEWQECTNRWRIRVQKNGVMKTFPVKVQIIFAIIIPTPQMKLTHTEDFVTHLK